MKCITGSDVDRFKSAQVQASALVQASRLDTKQQKRPLFKWPDICNRFIMSRKYLFHNNNSLYFVTFTTINWIDVFTREEYKNIILESIRYCQQEKGLEVFAWCLMTNHMHLIIRNRSTPTLSDIVRDLKAFTSRHIRKILEAHGQESRKGWMLWMMYRAGQRNSNNYDFQFWQQDNHPIELDTREKLFQRLYYLHNNPVKAGFVEEPEHWRWSSAIDYAGGKGLIDVILIE